MARFANGQWFKAQHTAHKLRYMTPNLLQGQMEEYMARQVSGYKNWQATITPKVRCWKERVAGPAGSCGQYTCRQHAQVFRHRQ